MPDRVAALMAERASIMRRIKPHRSGVSMLRARLRAITHELMRIENQNGRA